MNKAHFWSDIPKDWRASSSGNANKHAGKHGDFVINVKTLGELQSWFRHWVQGEESFDFIDFHTHGAPGLLCIGADELTIGTIYKIFTPKVDQIFNNDAQVIFNGCNVAEGHWGEYFLVKFGETMLKGGGGKVFGNTGLGIMDPVFTGDVFHPLGDWVCANVSRGGSVRLENHTHLVLENINKKISEAEETVQHLSAIGEINDSEKLAMITDVNCAKTFAAHPTDWNMFNACDHLWMFDKKLEKSKPRWWEGNIK
jgi:hypothetical protein